MKDHPKIIVSSLNTFAYFDSMVGAGALTP